MRSLYPYCIYAAIVPVISILLTGKFYNLESDIVNLIILASFSFIIFTLAAGIFNLNKAACRFACLWGLAVTIILWGYAPIDIFFDISTGVNIGYAMLMFMSPIFVLLVMIAAYFAALSKEIRRENQ